MMSLVKAVLPFLGVLAAVALLAGGAIVLTRGSDSLPPASEGGQVSETARSIPLIDVAAPAKIETATFALG